MLHDVNLLPWREEKRAQYRQRFVQLVILGVLIAVGIQWGLVGIYSKSKTIKVLG